MIVRLGALGALVVAFVALTFAVAAGSLDTFDGQVLHAMSNIWRPSLHPLFQAIAELGGLELTSILMLGLVIFLVRRGSVGDAWVLVAFGAAQVLETLYKTGLYHPGPPRSAAHADGPSITEVVARAGNSFPSGHMVRAVIVYGLIAFVVRRLAPSPAARALAIPIAVVLILVEAFDRLYLDVHWESDVIGGMLLGAIGLMSATVWLDRPSRRPEN
ncbi:MAG TPA: phosphatase PAP2 family protein [Candidatus Dormibacteraeota bacterium]|nr:phosphatase PAP2 family protein [Candidatus Dormibacteraeota bacterium]